MCTTLGVWVSKLFHGRAGPACHRACFLLPLQPPHPSASPAHAPSCVTAPGAQGPMPELLALTRPVSYSFLDAHLNCDFPASLVLDGAVNLPKDVAEMIPAVFRNDSCMMRSLIVEDPGGTSTRPFISGRATRQKESEICQNGAA